MYKGSGSRSLIDTSNIAIQKQNYANKLVQDEQTSMLKQLLSKDNCCDKILTNFANLQKQLEYLISLEEGEICGCLIELNTKKTELIQIMNDYLTQKITRIQTTNKLDILNSKIA